MTWNVDELQQRVEEALYVEPAKGSDRRVSAGTPRMIRYYTTQGLVDKPTMKGGQAFYEKRHLLQILAIKRLQAGGDSLQTIRDRIAGLSNRRLATLAKLPNPERLARAREDLDRHRRNFWAAPAAQADVPCFSGVLAGVELGPGMTFAFRATRHLNSEDVDEIDAAAQPLLQLLRDRRLLR